MPTINVHAAKTHFSRLVDEAAAGAEIIIAKAGKPLAKLVPLDAAAKPKRALGLLAGKAVIPRALTIRFPMTFRASSKAAEMRVLLDTSVLLRALIEPGRLTKRRAR